MKKKIAFILTLILMFTLVAQSSFAYAFSSNSPYTGETYQHNDRFSDSIVVNGIDVSQWQGTINWEKVKADGIDFAIIRAGGRFFVSGGLYFDDNFYQNIKAAQDAGIMVGVYYFSQAVTTAEAREEANWVLDYIEGYDLQLPIYMDYEMSSDPSGRINNLSKATRTANAKAFCSVIEAAGYETGVYSNLNFLNNSIDGAQLSGLYNMWAAQYNYRCQYASDYIMWQYSSDGSVDGISGRTDMNFMYLEEKPAATQARSIANCQITVAEAVYDGEANYEPEVTVTYNGAELTEGVDYELGYINNREVGNAYVYVKGTGQYADYQTVAFEIYESTGITDGQVTSPVYTFDRYVTGVSLETAAAAFKNNITASPGYTYKVLTQNGTEVTSGIIGTGMRVAVYDVNNEKVGEATVVVRGDSDGDGRCSVFDLIDMSNYMVGLQDLSGSYERALDVDNNGNSNIFDLIDICMYLTGLGTFE